MAMNLVNTSVFTFGILVLHLPVRSAIRYQNTTHRMSSLHIFLGYGCGDQIGTASGWHGDVQAVHPIF